MLSVTFLLLLLIPLLYLLRITIFKSCHLPGIYCAYYHPLFGAWPLIFPNLHRFHDFKVDQAQVAVSKGHEMIQRTGPIMKFVEVLSPRMVQYMLKDNFNNFVKGKELHGIFEELLGDGIFNSDGERWRTTRKIASHMFSASKLNQFMLDTFLKHAIVLNGVLQKEIQAQATDASRHIDIQTQFLRYTIDSICEIGFGINLSALTATTQPAFIRAFDHVQEATIYRYLGPAIKYKIQRFLNISTEKAVSENIPIIDEFVYGIIKTRRENAEMYQEAGDLLSLFISDHAKNNSNTEMDEKETRDLILNFMLAGRDTTASLLTWFFWEVSQRSELRRLLLEEIEEVFGAASSETSATTNSTSSSAEHGNGGDFSCINSITDTSLKRAIYLEAALLETLRLHPSVPGDSKRSVQECTFPDGSIVPAGYVCSYSPYTLGRLSTIWGDDVMEFKPERWLSEPDASGHRTLLQKSPFIFPAFNAGLRLCLGKSMAIMEAKVVAVSLLRKFKFTAKVDHDPIYKLNIVLFMKNGLPVRVSEQR